ncbi:MAG: hypothetical protein ACJA0U_000376 [Salibacteraceae bacterium]|jgi:hypothetical protein
MEPDETAQVKREMARENYRVVFPNPNNGIVMIQFDQQENRKTKNVIVGAQGKVVLRRILEIFQTSTRKKWT